MIKVAKFGGTSLSNDEQFKKVHDIIKYDDSIKYVIVSAPGSICNISNKITDMLYLCYDSAKNKNRCNKIFIQISQRFTDIVEKLGINIDIRVEMEKLMRNLTEGCSIDYFVSRGEYINSKILASYLDFDFIDAKDIIKFNENGILDTEMTDKNIRFILSKTEKAVIPGFYGSMYNGKIKTFSRGGSDITGSLVAKSMKADVYENWTDVSGLMVADPRIVKVPKKIDIITYRELRELAYMGASVLHDEAVFPVREANIPINIRNTNEPSDSGTLIVDDISDENNIKEITGISGRKGFAIFTLSKQNMASSVGTIKKALEVFYNRNIAVEHVPTGIDRFSIVVSQKAIVNDKDEIYNELMYKCKPENIDIYKNIALIGTVGRHIKNKASIFKGLFNALEKHNIDVKLISQCLSEINIIIGVDNANFEEAIKAIYSQFF